MSVCMSGLGNLKKSEIYTYTWNFDMCDTPSEREEFKLIFMTEFVRFLEITPI